ncbi:MAG: ribonuclease HII [Eubacteriales bacterium]|nr:ribonuclease HII [Eubacteriales bacterium]
MEKIGEIRAHMESALAELEAAEAVCRTEDQERAAQLVSRLEALIEECSADGRSGVQALAQKARKRLFMLEREKERIWQLQAFEREYASLGYVCGIDEVGRGPLAGPVVAGAVILPADCRLLYLNDSKQLSAKKRVELCQVILENAVAVGIGCVGPERIDEINILQATYEAMRQAIGKLEKAPAVLLNDAVTIPQVKLRQVPIIKGDAKSVSIAAASIVAKVTRDRMMEDYDTVFPGYGFAKNKGYGSAEHIGALRRMGPSPIHRKSFISGLL